MHVHMHISLRMSMLTSYHISLRMSMLTSYHISLRMSMLTSHHELAGGDATPVVQIVAAVPPPVALYLDHTERMRTFDTHTGRQR